MIISLPVREDSDNGILPSIPRSSVQINIGPIFTSLDFRIYIDCAQPELFIFIYHAT